MHDLLMIDGLQYSNWSEDIFRQMQEGGLSAVHATIAYHENAGNPVAHRRVEPPFRNLAAADSPGA